MQDSLKDHYNIKINSMLELVNLYESIQNNSGNSNSLPNLRNACTDPYLLSNFGQSWADQNAVLSSWYLGQFLK